MHKRLDLDAALKLARRIAKCQGWTVAMIELYGYPDYIILAVKDPESQEFTIKCLDDWEAAKHKMRHFTPEEED